VLKARQILGYSLVIIGMVLLTGAYYMYQNSKSFVENAMVTEGTVIELLRTQSRNSDSYSYRPIVVFETASGEAVEFISSTGSNPPRYSKGEKVEVLYLPSEPQSAKMKGFFSLWGVALILGGVGSITLLSGGIPLLAMKRKPRTEQYLRQHGTQIETRFQRVELNENCMVNRRHPFRVVTQWQDPSTSEIHVFQSDDLWFDPTDYISDEKITVYIAPDNPKKYVVDLSFLPNVAE